ncbi:MAG TPA: DUF3037 domain-containing protein [Candidatus Nanopelagicaceae bacterium]|nr:DUF3037 domain-containing protein [Candidatus Nanopelagicaceae bacterium]
MAKQIFSVIRCFPNPNTDEFVNIAAIAGNPETGDWALRQLSNESRVKKFAGESSIKVAHGFLETLSAIVNGESALRVEGSPLILDESWLTELSSDFRNTVQLTKPRVLLAEDASEALDIIFQTIIIDPVSKFEKVRKEKILNRNSLKAAMLASYKKASIDNKLLLQDVDLYVGDKLHASVDFAIANGSTLQLCQAYSFQLSNLDAVRDGVKSWAYTLRSLRDSHESAKLFTSEMKKSDVIPEVEIQVVVAKPRTELQEIAFEEAQEVFTEIDAMVRTAEESELVANRAVELISDHTA